MTNYLWKPSSEFLRSAVWDGKHISKQTSQIFSIHANCCTITRRLSVWPLTSPQIFVLQKSNDNVWKYSIYMFIAKDQYGNCITNKNCIHVNLFSVHTEWRHGNKFPSAFSIVSVPIAELVYYGTVSIRLNIRTLADLHLCKESPSCIKINLTL